MQATGPQTSTQQTALVKSGRNVTFANLMELYERNYILLKLLLADHDLRADVILHYPGKRYRLRLTPLDHERYTTTVLLTYSLLGRRRVLTHIVRLKIRIYRDTRQAELFRPAEYLSRDTAVTGGANKALAVRWVLNSFLSKLLRSIQSARYGGCVRGVRGHRII